MSEADLQKLRNRFEQIRLECNIPEKATALLQREGILDENGEPAERYREDAEAVICR